MIDLNLEGIRVLFLYCLVYLKGACLTHVLNWLSRNLLTLNASKSKAIMFGAQNSEIDLFLGHTFVDHHKCLDVVAENKLSYESHIDFVIRKFIICYRMGQD